MFHFFVLFVGDFTVLKSPKQGVEVLSSVPKHKRSVMCLMEKIHIR